MQVLAYDPYPNPNAGIEYVSIDELLSRSDVVSLHCPLTAETHHLIDAKRLSLMKPNAVIVNTSRGALIDSAALIEALKDGAIGGAALDVYEEEAQYFFEDHSNDVIKDDQLTRLLSFNNVLVTSHQAFFTHEALEKIAEVTFENIANLSAFRGNRETYLANEVCYQCEKFGGDCPKKNHKNCF